MTRGFSISRGDDGGFIPVGGGILGGAGVTTDVITGMEGSTGVTSGIGVITGGGRGGSSGVTGRTGVITGGT